MARSTATKPSSSAVILPPFLSPIPNPDGLDFLTALRFSGGYNPTGTFAPGAYISAVHWGDYNINVFAVDDRNTLVKTPWTKAASWQSTVALQTVITSAPIASIKVTTQATWIRVYTQPSGQLISELGSNDDGASFITMQSTIPVDS